MNRMLLAETAVLVELETIRVVPLVLHRIVVSLLAFSASERHLDASSCSGHCSHLLIVEMLHREAVRCVSIWAHFSLRIQRHLY